MLIVMLVIFFDLMWKMKTMHYFEYNRSKFSNWTYALVTFSKLLCYSVKKNFVFIVA